MDEKHHLFERLLKIGFSFYKEYGPNQKFVVSKHAVFEDPSVLEDISCDDLDEAIKIAQGFLNKPKNFVWQAIVRFNRGLGIEYKNLPEIEAKSLEDAEVQAKILAEKMKKDPKLIILEIKVRLKN